MPERYRKNKRTGAVEVSWDDGATWESHAGDVPPKEERTGTRPSPVAAQAVQSRPFVDEPPAQPPPSVPTTPEVVDRPPADAVPDRNVFARAYDWIKRDLSKGLGTGVPPEVRGIALGTTLGVAPKIAPQIVGGLQEAVEFMHPVDEPGLPPREFGGGRSTDPDRPIGATLGDSIAEAERREYRESLERDPIRTGVGYVAGGAPIAAAAAPFMAPAVGESALVTLGKAMAGSGLLAGAQAAHTGDPATVAKQTAIGAAFPAALGGGGKVIGAAEDVLTEGASRARLAAATGQQPYGQFIRKLVKEKGRPKMVSMGEVIEETGMAGTGPVAHKTTYMRNAERVLAESGDDIARIQGTMRGSDVKVDLGPTISALRSKAKELRSVGDIEALSAAKELERRAQNYAQLSSTRGGKPLTPVQAEAKADAIMSRASREQNDLIEAGEQLGMSLDEIAEGTDEIFANAQRRADAAKSMVGRYETDYAQAHDLRKWLDGQAWNLRTGDALQRDKARMYREVATTVRRSIGDAIEEEAGAFARPLREANEAYEAASWVKMHGDAGSSSRTSTLTALGAGGLAHGVGGEGIPTAAMTFGAAEAIRRYGPGALATAQRTGARVAAAAPAVGAGLGRASGLAAGAAGGLATQPDEQPQLSGGPDIVAQSGGDEVARVLALLDADPEAFGDQGDAVKRAAESGDIRMMRFTIADAMKRQSQEQQIQGAY